MSSPRIGIYSGTFDPVHAGHIAFALQAAEQANLDEVIFLPERRPRLKQGVEHFGHRVAMLNNAVRPHAKLQVLELHDKHFTIARTLPRLQKLFLGAELVFLVGSDVVGHIGDWPDATRLLSTSELVVGVRSRESIARTRQRIKNLPVVPRCVILRSHVAGVSSGKIRDAIKQRVLTEGSLPSVHRYASQNWLYVSINSL